MPLSNNFFAFDRSIPKPFDKGGKKISGVASAYSSGTDATLCAPMVKAVRAYAQMKLSSKEGAVGKSGGLYLAEYMSSVADTVHLCVYDPVSGKLHAAVHNMVTESFEQYKRNKSKYDGACVFLALMPAFLDDDEFADGMRRFEDEERIGHPDLDESIKILALLCDNIYRRLMDDTCAAHVPLTVDASFNLPRITRTHIDGAKYPPDTVFCGSFQIFAASVSVRQLDMEDGVPHADFVGKYVLSPGRTFSAFEHGLIPTLPEWYVIPQGVVDACVHICRTSGKPTRMRNILLRGPAGTGKTKGAMAIAAGLNLPYMKYTCSANTEVYDFVGQIIPRTKDEIAGAGSLNLDAVDTASYRDIAAAMGLPDADEMEYDPEGSYMILTGISKPDATPQDCVNAALERVARETARLKRAGEGDKDGPDFLYVETDFIRALKHGYLIEIQEPSVIAQPGVLVGLNDLLEQDGIITLPTGETVRRHPDAVVVITTNTEYEGCRAMNQSVSDRMNIILDVDMPSPEVMAKRVMNITGYEDEAEVSKMVQVVTDIAEHCRRNGITDGACGMRALIDWVNSAMITGDPYRSAMYTVISRAAADPDDRDSITEAALDPFYKAA